MPRPSARARRGRETRHLAGRRLSDGAAGDVACRAVREAFDHALSQPAGDGMRGAAAQPSDRRRGADGRLRQDHARPDHGRDLDGPAGDLSCRPGPMLRGNWHGRTLGSGSDVWKYWDEKRAGNIGEREWSEIEDGIARSLRHLHGDGHRRHHDVDHGSSRPDAARRSSIPAPDANHPRMCAASGRRIVDMVWDDLTPQKILSPAAFDNAIRVHMALGGSTNAIIHVIAMARRAGVALDMRRFDEISRQVPVIANITPSGKYLMEDFFYAGGLRALMAAMRDLLDLSCLTVTGGTLGDNIDGAAVFLPDVIHALDAPLYAEGATRRAHRQSCAARLRDEARRRRHALPQASRPRHRVRELRSHGARGGARRSRGHARSRAGAEKCRPEGRTRHARVGHAADPEKTRESRRPRHGAHLRRAHERHELWRLHLARRTGELRRRPAGAWCKPATRSRSMSPRAASICM